MINWQFCFLTDEYYAKFPNHGLLENKEVQNGKAHDRPCFLAFEDSVHKGMFWLVPVSSQYDKYKDIYDKNIARYGRCPFIRFGEFLGKNTPFLIQNICPATQKYIKNIYIDKNNLPVRVDNRVVADVVSNSRAVLAKVARGSTLTFTKVSEIKSVLLAELAGEENADGND
jgi:hypothetical protein